MQNPRLVYWLIVKIFTAIVIVALLWVFIGSLSTSNHSNKLKPSKSIQPLPLVKMDISKLQKGQIKKTRWGAKEVAVFYRNHPVTYHTKYIAKLPHESLSSGSRSQKPDYFVYVNHGDSGNCPLFYSAGTFKDTCTGKIFNSSGREINNKQQGYKLEIPPHYFEAEHIYFGQWKK